MREAVEKLRVTGQLVAVYLPGSTRLCGWVTEVYETAFALLNLKEEETENGMEYRYDTMLLIPFARVEFIDTRPRFKEDLMDNGADEAEVTNDRLG